MKQAKPLTSEALSSFCMELSLLLRAGYPMAEGLHLFKEESKHPVFAELCDRVDEGLPLSAALRQTGAFSDYLCHMVEIGERTGRLEETFRSLSDYYDYTRQLSRRIRSAVLYPALLLALMLAVIAVLLTKVLPVFNGVFQQLGGQMTGLGGGLLRFGQNLDAALPLLGALLLVLLAALIAGTVLPACRVRILRAWEHFWGNRGVARKVSAARLSAALSMGLSSGLPIEESLQIAMALHSENETLRRQMAQCVSLQEGGTPLGDALQEAELFPPRYCRMLSLGLRSGSADTVMQELARRMEEEAEEAVDALVSRVEPTMVLLSSVLVGAILLSVMLPLVNIMSALG